jgi:hypothetical protein
MSERHEHILDRLQAEYEPFSSVAGAELAQIDALREEMEKGKDPLYTSFRSHPLVIKLFKSAASTYKQAKMQMANDTGSLSQEERIRLHISTLWAQWYMQALGGDPQMIKEQTERDIENFARGAGIDIS